MRLRFSRRAETDLEEITAYIARDNPERAVTFIGELREHCRRLVMFPEARRLRPELGEGVRLSVFGNYVIRVGDRSLCALCTAQLAGRSQLGV